jgi:hypothetical protein
MVSGRLLLGAGDGMPLSGVLERDHLCSKSSQ